ncbi:MAG: acylphosphatase [Dissulfurimicrobium sp.]|uniref:acylphosphatase n=1 Tax=Dissulfurimicrobium sp. TaxID=2022436 RepID=UPI004049416B
MRGQVQGVGFRPFVYRLARRSGICGSVANNGDGVIIKAVAGKDALYAFINAINKEALPLARIDCVESRPLKTKAEI